MSKFNIDELVDQLGRVPSSAPAAAPPLPAKVSNGQWQGWYPIRGNAYPVKEELKKIGCRWNQDGSVWMAPNAQVVQVADSIVQRTGQRPQVVAPADLRGVATPDLVVALAARQDWPQHMGKHRLAMGARALGLRVGEELTDSLADLVAGDPPEVEELAQQLEKMEKHR